MAHPLVQRLYRLPVAVFLPKISTTVRSLRRRAGVAMMRGRFRLLSRISPTMAVAEACRLFLHPPRHAFSDAEFAALEEASLFPVPMVTGRLVGWRWGSARRPTVILVHGWGGRGAQLRHFVEPLLAKGFAVVTYDAPGHGMTGGEESSIVHFASALETVMAQISSVHALIGHSMGAAALTYALAGRSAVERAVLVAPPASLVGASQAFAKVTGLPEGLRKQMQAKIEHRFGVPWSEFEAEVRVGTQPLLVIHDAKDREIPVSEGRRYAKAWPAGRMMVTEGLGHHRLLADPDVIAAAVEFIAGEIS